MNGAKRPSRGHPEEPCRNCGDPTVGAYCPTCGQRKIDTRVSLLALLRDFVEDHFGVEHRTPITFFLLLFRPGYLTREYLDGKVVRYVRPFKLYLISSILLFLLVGFVSMRGMDGAGWMPGNDDREQPADTASADEWLDAWTDSGTRDEPPEGSDAEDSPADDDPASDTVSQAEDPVDSVPAITPPPAPPPSSNWLADADFNVNTGFQRLDALIDARVRRLGAMEPRDAIREVVRTFLNYVPTLMFLLLPVLAFVFKILYIGKRMYYTEHFIFVLHTHAFLFLVFSLAIVAGWFSPVVASLLVTWGAIYIYLALRRVYGQGHLMTAFKYWTLGWMYFWILLVALPPAFIVTLLFGG